MSGRQEGRDTRDARVTYGDYDPRDDVRAPGWEEAAAAAVAEVPGHPDAAPLAADAVEGNLRRYARWQWRDFWQRRGVWTAAAALFCVWLLSWITRNAGPARGPMGPDEVNALAHAAFAVGGALAALLGTGGLVARERERGLQRFLFAKPVNAVRYYLQGFAVNGVGSMLVVLGAALLAAVALPAPIALPSVLAAAALTYVATSGVTFLASTLMRWDAPVAAVWLAAGFPIAAAAHEGMWWGQLLQWLFPQGPAMAVFKALAPGGGAGVQGVGDVIVPLAGAGVVGALYGLACVAAAVTVLRRRAIST